MLVDLLDPNPTSATLSIDFCHRVVKVLSNQPPQGVVILHSKLREIEKFNIQPSRNHTNDWEVKNMGAITWTGKGLKIIGELLSAD